MAQVVLLIRWGMGQNCFFTHQEVKVFFSSLHKMSKPPPLLDIKWCAPRTKLITRGCLCFLTISLTIADIVRLDLARLEPHGQHELSGGAVQVVVHPVLDLGMSHLLVGGGRPEGQRHDNVVAVQCLHLDGKRCLFSVCVTVNVRAAFLALFGGGLLVVVILRVGCCHLIIVVVVVVVVVDGEAVWVDDPGGKREENR